MKKILYIIPRFIFGGAEVLLLHTVNELQKTGEYEVVVAAVRGGGELENKFVEAGARTFVASRGGLVLGTLITYLRLWRLVRNFSPDIIHSHVFSADFLAAFLPRRKQSVRWLTTQHNGRELYSPFRRAVLRFILPRADLVIGVAPTVRDFCVRDLQLPTEKVVLIINGIPLDRYRCAMPPRLISPFHVITVGRLTAQKNQALLLRALAELKKFDWVADVYGEGEKLLELEFLAQKLKIFDRIKFQGSSAHIHQAFCGADVVVQTSDFEGRALVVMEAMAAGRIVIATKAAGEGIIVNGVDGIILAGNDSVRELQEALTKVFENSEQVRSLAIAAVKNSDKFSFANTFAALKNVYEQTK